MREEIRRGWRGGKGLRRENEERDGRNEIRKEEWRKKEKDRTIKNKEREGDEGRR
jgi:hypothetical protein